LSANGTAGVRKIVSHERLLTTDRGGHNARRVKRDRRDLPARHQGEVLSWSKATKIGCACDQTAARPPNARPLRGLIIDLCT
jgi:hypothetical protein